MGTPYNPPEHERPAWLPPGATALRAEGTPSSESLDSEYQPSPERIAAFLRHLQDLEVREQQAKIDDLYVRF